MKALIFNAPGEPLFCQDVPIPTIDQDQLLVRVRSAGICGTDLQYYCHHDLVRKKRLRCPFILGHEMAGDVVEVGQNVKRFFVGDRITTETHVPCGKCFFCLNDQQHVCEHLEPFAQKMGGVFAEYCRVPEYCARKLPEGVGYKLGSLFEPLGVAVRAVLEAGCQGDSLLVTGCGPIGLMAIGAARSLGAAQVLATDIVPERLQMALKMGAEYAMDGNAEDTEEIILQANQGLGSAGFIEASGSPSAFCLGMRTLRTGGKAIIVGLSSKLVEVDVSQWIVAKEAKVIGIHGRKMFHTWRKMESLVANNMVDLEPVMGDSFPLESYKEAFSLALSGKKGKIFIEP